MKIKLNRGFTDVEIDGKIDYSPFMAGDEVDVLSIRQTCSDRGCCELEYLVQTPEWNGGNPFVGYKYYDPTELDLEAWEKEWNKDLMFVTYYPPKLY